MSSFVTLGQMAEAFGVSRPTAARILNENPGFGIVLNNGQRRTWRIPRIHVERVIAGASIESVAAAARALSAAATGPRIY